MGDGLAAIFASVNDHAITLVEILGAGDAGGGPEQVAEQRCVVPAGFDHGDNVLARRDKDVDRRLWVDVRKGVAKLILIDGGGGDAPLNDHAKEATHSGFSLQERDGVGVSETRIDATFAIAVSLTVSWFPSGLS
jgi:hypothetical protein